VLAVRLVIAHLIPDIIVAVCHAAANKHHRRAEVSRCRQHKGTHAGATKLGSSLTDATRESRSRRTVRVLPLCCRPNVCRNDHRGPLTRWNHSDLRVRKAQLNSGPINWIVKQSIGANIAGLFYRDVRSWHLADNPTAPENVRFWTKADTEQPLSNKFDLCVHALDGSTALSDPSQRHFRGYQTSILRWCERSVSAAETPVQSVRVFNPTFQSGPFLAPRSLAPQPRIL